MSQIHTVLAFVLVLGIGHACFAQWEDTIKCPPNRVHRDERMDAGRQEYCEQILPGSLRVKDGPFRFWFSRDFEGGFGNYSEGREVGKWKECNRFHTCEEKDYPAIYPHEKLRPGFRSEIPVSYVDGKYIFDFASCRSTWITHTDGEKVVLELNIGGYPSECQISYLPKGLAAYSSDGTTFSDGSYTCKIPFSVGKKTFGSLDVRTEFAKANLPQYCTDPVQKIRVIADAQEVIPGFGEGLAEVFDAKFSTGRSGADILQARLHFQDGIHSRTHRCVARYDPPTKKFYLLADDGKRYLGPMAAGGTEALWNSRCLLSGCSNAEVSGNVLTVHFAIRFNPATFAGRHDMFQELVDDEKHSPAVAFGDGWSVPSEPPETVESAWPSDRSCPNASPVPNPFLTSGPAVDCRDVSGTWFDSGRGGTWTLSQNSNRISGSLTIGNDKCGTVTWRVSGEVANNAASVRATQPTPTIDKCGRAAPPSIGAIVNPDCTRAAFRVDVKH